MNFQAVRLSASLGLALATAGLACSATAQDWANWRGPAHNGSSPATDLPVEFSKRQGVAWSTDLPGPGASTPIVLGDRIFLTSVDTKRNHLMVVCLDRKTGKVRWQEDATKESGRVGGRRANFASPSAVTDGEVVVFFFGNGDLLGYDLDGKRLWARNIQTDYGKFAFNWTFAASPTLWEGKLFLPVLQRNVPVGRGRRGQGNEARPDAIDSFILAMEPKTGKTVYKHVRPSPAQVESLESYTTTIPHVTKDGEKQLLLVGGDVLTAHNPDNGKELWRWGTWNTGHRERFWRLVPTVVVGGGVAVICAPKRAPVYAVKLGGKGTISYDDGLAWKSGGRTNPVSSDVPTPAFDGKHFYVLSDVRNALSKVEPKTGKVLWTRTLSRDYLWRSSPTVADGKVYCMNHNGEIAVVNAETGKVLHHAFMGSEDDDQIRSSVVAAHGQLLIRTNDKLFCIAKTGGATKKKSKGN